MLTYYVLAAVVLLLAWYLWPVDPALDIPAIRGQRVIVTGASSGVGFHMSEWYARYGASILITARRAQVLEENAKKLMALGAQKVVCVAGDIGDPAFCKQVVERAIQEFGGIDTLALNAAQSLHAFLENIKDDASVIKMARSIIDTNYLSTVYMCRYAIPALKQSRGRIVATSSLSARMGAVLATSLYVAGKMAMEGFMSTLRAELRASKSNVTVTVCPCGFLSELTTMYDENGREIREGGATTWTGFMAMESSECARLIVHAGQRRETDYHPMFGGRLVQIMCAMSPQLGERLSNLFFGLMHRCHNPACSTHPLED